MVYAYMVIEERRENCVCFWTVKGKKFQKTVGINFVMNKGFSKRLRLNKKQPQNPQPQNQKTNNKNKTKNQTNPNKSHPTKKKTPPRKTQNR